MIPFAESDCVKRGLNDAQSDEHVGHRTEEPQGKRLRLDESPSGDVTPRSLAEQPHTSTDEAKLDHAQKEQEMESTEQTLDHHVKGTLQYAHLSLQSGCSTATSANASKVTAQPSFVSPVKPSAVRSRLTKPFRSPLVKSSTVSNSSSAAPSDRAINLHGGAVHSSPKNTRVINYGKLSTTGIDGSPPVPSNYRFLRAASKGAEATTRGKDTELEQLQLRIRRLKQAIKYLGEDNDKPLQESIDLWRAKGQEAASELFNKFPPPDPDAETRASFASTRSGGYGIHGFGDEEKSTPGSGGRLADSWGWSSHPQPAAYNEAYGLEEAEESRKEAEEQLQEGEGDGESCATNGSRGQRSMKTAWNIGYMLEKIGLPKAILRWDDTAEDFVS
ncbi:hypothetical protein K437DRAFT_267276 [Tilletiaria anomala UBC 951]|uniref:Uncharacterized protein n=1 Tax=Tilletiaria anomala (strain ATCC 24038 / CBS 436.72 / UBC 951) TaxID=1037660 RepID=A0A066WH59_TILAU|nr:uncharacterized protein K437DRAFT_267276 [Tilletiaria anomala UBC 951]KDN50369.1 hypothetical protein K437DRAFT_267276 [Tilletiaria anomala UBC 951]